MLIGIISQAQCAEIQCVNHQISMCDVQFKVVNNIQLLSLIFDITHITVTRSQFMKDWAHYSGYVTQNSYVSSRVLKKKNFNFGGHFLVTRDLNVRIQLGKQLFWIQFGAVAEPAPTKVADTKMHSPKGNRNTIGCHLHTSTHVAS